MKVGEFIKVEASEFLGTEACMVEVVDTTEVFSGRPVVIVKEIGDTDESIFYVTLEAPHRLVSTIGHEVLL